MNLLPKASGTRPRVACEISPGGVFAGRSPEAGLPLSGVARAQLPERALIPGLKPGNIADRVAVIAAVRRTLESLGVRPTGRNTDVTLVLPDAAVRVLLLDFDALPSKLSEALPIVRFRLRKLVPFDADEAMVSFQVLSTSRSLVRVLAVAMPRDVLSEYESVVREAGFEPGSVLPSTLASLAVLEEASESAALVVNAHATGVTTAIVRGGLLLLHRAVETAGTHDPLPDALFAPALAVEDGPLALVDREESQAEWAMQEPLPEFGREVYVPAMAESAAGSRETTDRGTEATARPATGIDMYAAADPDTSLARSPYASARLQESLHAQFHGETEDTAGAARYAVATAAEPEAAAFRLGPELQAVEIAEAVSVAMAFFEDNLAAKPELVFSAGSLPADALDRILQEQGVAESSGIHVRELVDVASLAPQAASAAVPRHLLAGVMGALRS